MTHARQPFPHDEATIRYGGALVGLGSLATVGIIVLFLSAGGHKLVGSSGAEVADVLTDGADALRLVGLLSLPANLLIIVGALMLTHRPPVKGVAPPVNAMWYAVAVAFILVMLYDLALPFLLIPLAADYAANAAVFDGLYATFDLGHSIGLLLTFVALGFIFWGEARRVDRALPRAWSHVANVACLGGIILTASFLAGNPLVFLAPSALIIWLSLGAMGVRLAMRSPSLGRDEQDKTIDRPRRVSRPS